MFSAILSAGIGIARHACVGGDVAQLPSLFCTGGTFGTQISQFGSKNDGLSAGCATLLTARLSTCSNVDQIHCGELSDLCAMCMPTMPTTTGHWSVDAVP